MAEQAKTRDPNTMDINATQNSNNKSFNCSGDYFAKECKKPMLQCGKCKFLGGRHKKDCSCHGKGGQQACSAKKEEEGATSWDKNKSTKKEKDNKGKSNDWSKYIQGMSQDEARACFKDYETLAVKLGKA